MHNNKARRFLSVLLTIVFLTGLVPVMAAAENTDYEYVIGLESETQIAALDDSIDVTLKISSPKGSLYNAVQAVVIYDSVRLQYSGSNADANTRVTSKQAGKLLITSYDKNIPLAGGASASVVTLTFTAKALGSADISIATSGADSPVAGKSKMTLDKAVSVENAVMSVTVTEPGGTFIAKDSQIEFVISAKDNNNYFQIRTGLISVISYDLSKFTIDPRSVEWLAYDATGLSSLQPDIYKLDQMLSPVYTDISFSTRPAAGWPSGYANLEGSLLSAPLNYNAYLEVSDAPIPLFKLKLTAKADTSFNEDDFSVLINHPYSAYYISDMRIIEPYSITWSVSGGEGSVTGPDKASPGTEVEFSAAPQSGYLLQNLRYTIDGGQTYTRIGMGLSDTSLSFIMPGADVVVEAAFVAGEPTMRIRLDSPVLSMAPANRTADSITLETPAPSAQDPDAVLLYAVREDGSVDWSEWQKTPVFSGLNPKTNYYFTAKYEAYDTARYVDSNQSNGVSFRTLAESSNVVKLAPPTLAISIVYLDRVVFSYPDGVPSGSVVVTRFSTDGANWGPWQNSSYQSLTPNTLYWAQAMLVATNTTVYSDSEPCEPLMFWTIAPLEDDLNAPEKDENGFYMLATADDLVWLSGRVNHVYSDNDPSRSINAILTEDIDLTGRSDFEPIGNGSNTFVDYCGVFDGGGHSVTLDLVWDGPYAGLFGKIENDASIKDLTVKGSVTGRGQYTGGIVAFTSSSYAMIDNCASEATVTGIGSSYTGGVIGYSTAWISGCINTGTVTGEGSVGGIAGLAGGGGGVLRFTKCVNTGDVVCVGAVAGPIPAAGGIVGNLTSSMSCMYNSGAVTSVTNAGGVAGYINGGLSQNVGGINALNCINVGTVSSTGKDYAAGGIAGNTGSGRNGGDVIMESCYNGGSVYSAEAAGGIFGYFTGVNHSNYYGNMFGLLRNNYNTGAVTGGEGADLGPVVGAVSDELIELGRLNIITNNFYSVDCIAENTEVLTGTVADSVNALIVTGILQRILDSAGVNEQIKYNTGGYPIPESLWDGFEGGGTGDGYDVPVRVAFNVTPEGASVEVKDAGGEVVRPAGNNAFMLEIGGAYSYTINAEGYTTHSGTLIVTGARSVVVSLVLANKGEYLPGWDKWRPSFGIYILNRDGTTGTRIGNWTYDTAKSTYVDKNGVESSLITHFDSPLVYSGMDRFPAARIGVVKSGILADDLIAYYNANRGQYPEINASSYNNFAIMCATNSGAGEDPYTSNDPTMPGKWDWFGVFDTFTGTSRYYYPNFLIGVNASQAPDETNPLYNKQLGMGTKAPALIALQSYNARVMEFWSQLQNASDLQDAIDFLLDRADTERAMRNFEGMIPQANGTFGNTGRHPLGADSSYWIGSVWITPPYKNITTNVTGGMAQVILTGAVDDMRAVAGETVEFAVLSAGDVTVTFGGETLTPIDGVYSFTMPDSVAEISVQVSGDTGESYDITVQSTLGGTISANKTAAKAGETVTVTVEPDEGNQLRDGSLKYNGVEITQTAGIYRFTMPAEEVTITAFFDSLTPQPGQKFSIEVAANITGGTVTADKTEAEAGETVTVTVTPGSNMRLIAGSLQYDGRAINAGASGKYTFVMPTWNVTLTAQFTATSGVIPPGDKEDPRLSARVWDGTIIDIRWFTSNPNASSYSISTPAQLAGLAALVNGLYNKEIDTVAGDAAFIKVNTGLGDESGPQGNNKSTSTFHYGDYNFTGKTIYLTADIDMGSANYMPIGGQYLMTPNDSTTRIDSSFCGVFDGQGHSVTINCDRHCSTGNYGDGQSVGLIGRLGVHDNDPASTRPSGAAVRNVAVYGSVYANRSVGGIVGKIGKTSGGAVIENCANFADVYSTDAKGCGGIAGAAWNGGTIRNCYNAGSVTSTHTNPTGGIAGSVEILIENCYNVGAISAPSGYAMAIGTNNGGGSQRNNYYLAGSAPDGGWYSGNTANNDGEKTDAEMKADAFVTLLGSAYRKDTNNTNGGYPVLVALTSQGGGSPATPIGPGGTTISDSNTPLADAPDNSVTVEVKAKVNGATAAATADPEAIMEAIAEAKEDNKTNITLSVTEAGSAASIELGLTVADVKELIESGMSLSVKSDNATLIFDIAVLTGVTQGKADGDLVKVVMTKVDPQTGLSVQQQAIVGSNTVYDLSVLVGGVKVQNFAGTVIVRLPGIPEGTDSDDYDLLTVYFLDGNGNVTEMKVAGYNAFSGEMLFATDHFSLYFVSEWICPFNDIQKTDWFYRAVRFAYSNGLVQGTSASEYSPNSKLSRAMLVTLLWRLEGEPEAPFAHEGGGAERRGLFSDVAAGSWYADAVAWAAANGIVEGYSNGQFGPSDNITREQFATILMRYAKFKGIDTTRTTDLAAFTDVAQISGYAENAMKWANATGIITGRTETNLAPRSTATRAEAAMLLKRFIESMATSAPNTPTPLSETP